MNQLEQNIMNSFRIAKNDIIKLQNEIIELKETQERLVEEFAKAKSAKKKVITRIKTKTITKPSHHKMKHYIGSKEGKKFHIKNCPFAKNIKPNMSVRFKSKTAALNKGYKPCSCVN